MPVTKHKQPRPRTPEEQRLFPLHVRFVMNHAALNGKPEVMTAGFRDWPHYLAYVAQCKERNNATVRNPVEINEDGTRKRNH